MPKQILVANKSRKQTVKVNFRQSPFALGCNACETREIPGLVIWARVWPTKRVFYKGVENMYDLPGVTFQKSLIALLLEKLRTKMKTKTAKNKNNKNARNNNAKPNLCHEENYEHDFCS